MAERIVHRSHDHPLEHMGTMDASVRAANCRACGLPFESENVDLFGCGSCGFFLHRSCCNMPTSFKNPAHPQHQLELRFAPAYSSGHFPCYICGDRGQGFNYHCSKETCQFDAHVPCVNLPSKARSPAHQHRLQLLFRPPAMGRTTSCGVCGLQIQYCCYFCSRCSFFLHPQCLKKQPSSGCSNNQQGPQQGTNNQQGPTKQKKGNLGKVILGALVGGVATGVVRGIFGGIDFPDIDIGGCHDDAAGEDNDVQDVEDDCDDCEDVDDDCDDDDDDDDFADDMSTFGQPPGSGGYFDSVLRAEARSLAFKHMARMGGGA